MYLDLSKAKLPKWWPEITPKKLPICKGTGRWEFEVIMEKCPKDWIESHRDAVLKLNPGKTLAENFVFGFDSKNLPKGAKIVKGKP